MGGTLERVLFTIRALHAKGFWVEVVTLVVPGHQRLGRGAAGHRALPRLGVARHPVARDRVPPRLQDGRPAARRRCSRCCGPRRRAPPRACASSTRATCPGAVRSWENTYCPGCRGAAGREARVPDPEQPDGRERALPRLPADDTGGLGLQREHAERSARRTHSPGRTPDPVKVRLDCLRGADSPRWKLARDLRARVAQRALVVAVLHLRVELLGGRVDPGGS